MASSSHHPNRLTLSSLDVHGSGRSPGAGHKHLLPGACDVDHSANYERAVHNPGATRGCGAVLSNGSGRDLPVTRSISATQRILARYPLWYDQMRSRRVSVARGQPFVPVD
jgi:hypothetical protein